MDNQNTKNSPRGCFHIGVLILVLMDNQNTHFKNYLAMGICLNPCSNG